MCKRSTTNPDGMLLALEGKMLSGFISRDENNRVVAVRFIDEDGESNEDCVLFVNQNGYLVLGNHKDFGADRLIQEDVK